MMALKQLLRRGGDKYGDQLEWIDTTVQPADVLTKSMEDEFLRKMLTENTFDTMATVAAQLGKKRKAELRQARRSAEKHGEAAAPFGEEAKKFVAQATANAGVGGTGEFGDELEWDMVS